MVVAFGQLAFAHQIVQVGFNQTGHVMNGFAPACFHLWAHTHHLKNAHSGMSALGAMHGLRATRPLLASPDAMAAEWPPLLVIHGSADHVVAVSNGHAAVQAWAGAAGACAAAPRTQQRGQRYPMTVTDFSRGRNTVATLVEVARLGHAWSGGAAKQPYSDGQGPDASRMVWAFAARQFRIHPGA